MERIEIHVLKESRGADAAGAVARMPAGVSGMAILVPLTEFTGD